MSEEKGLSYSNQRKYEKNKFNLDDEKAKLAEMSAGQKVEYILGYYKIHILIALGVIALIVYLIHHAFTYTKPALYCTVVNSTFYNEQASDSITDYVGMDKHEVCEFHYVFSEVDPATGAMYNEIDIYTAANTMDVQFTDQKGADYMCGLGSLYNVQEVLPQRLLDIWADRIVYMDEYDYNTDSDFYTAPVAIDISGTAVQKYFGLTDEVKYFTVTNLSGHEEYLNSFFDMLYDIETGALEVQ